MALHRRHPVAAKLLEPGKTIELRQRDGFAAAQRAIRNGDNGQAMTAIRQQVMVLAENERRFLLRRQADTREHERDAVLVGVFIAALSVTTRILITLGIRHAHQKRQAEVVDDAGEPAQPAASGSQG